MFCIYIANVNRGIVYVAMAVHVCCKRLFQLFHLFFQTMLQVFLFRCCVCFTYMFASVLVRMLHMFCNVFLSVFGSVLDAYFKCFIFLQTYITKVLSRYFKIDQVYML